MVVVVVGGLGVEVGMTDDVEEGTGGVDVEDGLASCRPLVTPYLVAHCSRLMLSGQHQFFLSRLFVQKKPSTHESGGARKSARGHGGEEGKGPGQDILPEPSMQQDSPTVGLKQCVSLGFEEAHRS